jgi:hypothetical protein
VIDVDIIDGLLERDGLIVIESVEIEPFDGGTTALTWGPSAAMSLARIKRRERASARGRVAWQAMVVVRGLV